MKSPDRKSKSTRRTASNARRSSSVLKAALVAKTAELSQREHELLQLNEWFEVALNNMARGLSMFDSDQRLIVCNKAYQEIYELPDALTKRGTSLAKLMRYYCEREFGKSTPRDKADRRAWIERHVAELARGETFTHTQHLKNGRIILVTNKPLPGGGWVDVQEDITERRKAEQQINWLARHDPLTEVSNRMHFREELDKALKSLRPTFGFAIHWIDLDRFKQVNDTLGHPVGDALLKSIAKRLLGSARDGDVVARLGGDEFIVLQAGAEEWSEAEQLAERLLVSIREPHFVLGHTVECGASIGIALAPQQGRNADELMRCADVALYDAKMAGRNCYRFFEAGSEHTNSGRNSLAEELKHALDDRQLELYYQPIIDPKGASVVAFEGLMRWHHPKRGTISPAEFIPMAEETGFIVEIGAWALRQACTQAKKWPGGVGVTVNLSPVQFERGNVYHTVSSALEQSGLEPRRLELEITEGVLLRDQASTQEALHKLRSLGVRIALDDFGTAYASLSYLRRFPFDKIKIDRSFVQDLDLAKRNDCVAIITAVSALARQLQMRTVIEGVETSEHAETVLGAGCDELQGFYFSEPVPAKDVLRVIRECPIKLSMASDAETVADLEPGLRRQKRSRGGLIRA